MATPSHGPTMESSDDSISKPTMVMPCSLLPDLPTNRRSHTGAEFKVTLGYGDGGVLLENAKVKVKKLYMPQISAGGYPCQPEMNAVKNWEIYDEPAGYDYKENVVANVYGTQTLTGNGKWSNWFTIEFVDKRFKGSTLQVMGANGDIESDWAIVGGTGDFEMARGIIRRRAISVGDRTQELTVVFFCCMSVKEVVPEPKEGGTVGANTGNLREFKDKKSQRLESVTISSNHTVEGLRFSYIDENGKRDTAGTWGTWNSYAWYQTEIKFGPSEFVKEIRGTESKGWLCQFEIVTTHKTYGPFGGWNGTPNISCTVPEGQTVVGFFAKTDNSNYITAIGVYTIPKTFSL